MARAYHRPVFHPRLVRERIKSLDPALFVKHAPMIGVWLGHLRSGALDETKEVGLHGGFLERIFGDILGYPTRALARAGQWELVAEKSVHAGGSTYGAIGFFANGASRVIAPIELKGASQFLEPNQTAESRWSIVSNCRETRLYAKSHGQAAYELFRLEDLATEPEFLRFVALLGRDAILGGPSLDQSPLAELLLASELTEREVTAKLYAQYRQVRARLFEELRGKHANIPPDQILSCCQTILDRVLFVAFAEDRHLLPRHTLTGLYEQLDPYQPRPIWHNFLALFPSIDKGSCARNIPPYNGGLFRHLPLLDELEVSDETCGAFRELGDYDFVEDVSVDVLGHIFEQSITDLEQLRQQAAALASTSTPTIASAGAQKPPSKRKAEGIFYTPSFVTSYLVRETLGQAMKDAWEQAGVERAHNKKERIAAWEAYQNQLRRLRVLDPACGSGAFLIAAFDALAQEFDRAHRALAELRQGQVCFFDWTQSVLNENLFGVDKSQESVEITKLSLWLKTAEPGQKLTYLDRNVRHGNSVVSDPLVEAWAFDWSPAGEVAHSIDDRWREGFDVVLGNPPYVRQELLTPYKEHWSRSFQVYEGMADLFVYFFERGVQQLKLGGRLGFIVSNKWLRGGYGKKLRALLTRECSIETIVDFGHAPIFPDADAFPCIITLRKVAPDPSHSVRVTFYPREELGKELLASYVEANHYLLPQTTLSEQRWLLDPPQVQRLVAKLKESGAPLGEYGQFKPYRGLLTGYNAAFILDRATKDRLCREDPRSAGLLKPYLRGQDIARWSPKWAGLWLLLLKSSTDHAWPWSSTPDETAAEHIFSALFPAVYGHLKPLEPTLRKRTDKGRFWWELRSCTYYERFEQPRLLYPDILWRADFCLASAGTYVSNSTYLLPTGDAWLLACLNAPAVWSYLWRTAQHGKDDALRMFSEYVLTIPIATPTESQKESVLKAVAAISAVTGQVQSAVAGVLDLLRIEYHVESPGQALADFARLTSAGFAREVRQRRKKVGPPLSPAGLKALRTVFAAAAPGIQDQRAQILTQERTIATAVHAAYRLTAEDLSVLRKTQPLRMPPGW